MDRSEITLASTMGIGTVQAYTTFLGSISTADMMDEDSYKRGLGLTLGWSFIVAIALAKFSDSYAPFIAWIITSGAMLSAYEYQRDRASAE